MMVLGGWGLFVFLHWDKHRKALGVGLLLGTHWPLYRQQLKYLRHFIDVRIEQNY